MTWRDLSTSLSDRFLRREIVREDEIVFLFVDGRFERILPPGRHRVPPANRAVLERVPLATPRVGFAGIAAILDRPEVRQVTSSIHVDEGKLGLAFHRGVFHELLAPGLHVFVRAPDGPPAITFDVLTPQAGAELIHPNADAIARAPDAARWLKTVQIEAGSLGILYVDGVLARRLDAGRHLLFEHGHTLRVDIARNFEPVPAPDIEALLTHPDLKDSLTEVRVSDHERGLVFAGDVFRRFLAPGHYVFANTKRPPLRIEKVDVLEPEITHPEVRALMRASDAAAHMTTATIAQGQVGLLFVDGVLRTRLAPGVHAFWTGARTISIQIVDLREVGLEVQGQELLTADKVSLRINLSVRYRVVDVDRAILAHADFKDALHRCLQLALRDEVQRLTLDELLSRKEDVGAAVSARAAEGTAVLGVEVRAAGLRDVILPGEMRQILNQVVEAERRAQANLITRREETAAARSLLNTARLLDENPTLMRLKELEHAERIAEKIGSLSVIGGIDALLPRIREALKP